MKILTPRMIAAKIAHLPGEKLIVKQYVKNAQHRVTYKDVNGHFIAVTPKGILLWQPWNGDAYIYVPAKGHPYVGDKLDAYEEAVNDL